MGTTTNPFRYSGEYFDEESGLIYLRNRYYNPEIGRFITEDPIQDGLNWYAYCGNNPINFVDPSGLVVTEWDRENLSKKDLNQIIENDLLWRTGNEEDKKIAAESSRNIRKKYLTEGQRLLDNGYVEETLTNTSSYSTSYTNTDIVVTTEIERRYEEKYKYVTLKNVEITISVNSGFAIDSMTVINGQNGLLSERTVQTDATIQSNYSFSPNWGYVIDDNGVYTTIGTCLELSVSRPNGKEYHSTIFNQLYNQMMLDENKRILYNPDGFEILYESLKRGERH